MDDVTQIAFSLAEVRKRLRQDGRPLSPQALLERCWKGHVPSIKVGGVRRVLLDDLNELFGGQPTRINGEDTVRHLFDGRDIVSARELGEALGIGHRAIQSMAARSAIPAQKVAGRWLFNVSRLREFLIGARHKAVWEWIDE